MKYYEKAMQDHPEIKEMGQVITCFCPSDLGLDDEERACHDLTCTKCWMREYEEDNHGESK